MVDLNFGSILTGSVKNRNFENINFIGFGLSLENFPLTTFSDVVFNRCNFYGCPFPASIIFKKNVSFDRCIFHDPRGFPETLLGHLVECSFQFTRPNRFSPWFILDRGEKFRLDATGIIFPVMSPRGDIWKTGYVKYAGTSHTRPVTNDPLTDDGIFIMSV